MNNAHNMRHLERVQKEFLQEMVAKGKIAGPPETEAWQRKMKSYYQTGPRLFPGPGGLDTALDTMIKESERRIDERTQNVPAAKETAAAHQGSRPGSKAERKEQHKALQERLLALERNLEAERHCRKTSEERLIQAQLEKEKEERRLAEEKVSAIRAQQANIAPEDIWPYKSSSLANYSSAVGSKWWP